ncbi:hypothetical protein ALISP_1277 [Alicycliphilus sp. B1]|nr:hypothetical protein ALISP_1277 [Alicycliphilus sp. B1]
MHTDNKPHSEQTQQARLVEVTDATLVFRQVAIDDETPTGAQIAAAAGFSPAKQVTVLLWLPSGALEDIRPDEIVHLQPKARFIVVESDTSYRLTIDGKRVDWPARRVSGAIIRGLGDVPSNKSIYYERQDQPDQQLDDTTIIDLASAGVEAFYSRAAIWILNVQGVRLEVHQPTIVVREAMTQAGFNPEQGWHIFLKVAGQPKQAVELTTVIDLRTPGIEKLRLTPKDVNNGEAARNAFALLDVDEAFLDQRFAFWETLVENGRRWLLICGYPVPEGYTTRRITLALEVPPNYPGAQIDMFYALPHLALHSGNALANTEAQVTIEGKNYQRWSRHRGPSSEWKSGVDNVITHLALVESALLKEVPQ